MKEYKNESIALVMSFCLSQEHLSTIDIFCYMCGCSAASVTVVDGLKAVAPKKKCPLCRQVT